VKKHIITQLKRENIKTEKAATLELKSVVFCHSLLDDHINEGDKGLSWDGYISIYNSEIFSKDSWVDDVPVQVKGTVDVDGKLHEKKTIQFKTDIGDLRNYFKDRGVIYFVIVTSPDYSRKEIYYNLLYPSKLKAYIEEAERKGNRKNFNISLIKMKKEPDEIYRILKQFSFESKRQGFGYEQIVQNLITINDVKNLTEITATAIGVNSEREFIEKVMNGDVTLYGKRQGADILYPFENNQKKYIVIRKTINQKVKIGEKLYYSDYEIIENTKENQILSLSENLQFDMKQKAVRFVIKTKIDELYRDATFLIAILNSDSLTIGNQTINNINLNIDDNFMQVLEFIIDTKRVFDMMEYKYLTRFDEQSSEDRRTILWLVELIRGEKNHLLTEELHTYSPKLEEKYIPLIIRKEPGKEIELLNRVYSRKHQIFVADDDEKVYYKVPLFADIELEVFSNIYTFDYEELYRQIYNSDCNEYTAGTMNYAALQLIATFDINRDDEFLSLAMQILERLLEVFPKDDIYLINIMQIKKRRDLLDKDDKDILYAIKERSDIQQIHCCVNILIGNYFDAKKNLERMGEEERNIFKGYPIINLMN
jgi:hypothetical protein